MDLNELRVAALKQASDDSRLNYGGGGIGIGLPSQPAPEVIIARAKAYLNFLDPRPTTPSAPQPVKKRRVRS